MLGGDRWRLNRAGIINVYQYEHEVIDLHGGRLLLRGVNGSGKSTAMNMLLPFLVTARQARIDASGEQSGVLKSWMLNGRDDAQPVGYLWVEFECAGRHLTCGCGIKANRSSDNVTTWWFITDRRPEIDISFVEGKVPLSADALRATLDGPGDEVFHERARRDYRRSVERRLFGGASIDPYIDLLNVVRNPRIGDRIDVDLPAHLVDALPHLSEQALAEAAQPLDDLETHRRNVDELGRTRDAIEGLLDVYRPYAITQLGRYADRGSELLSDLRAQRRRERRAIDASAEADQHRLELVAEHDRAVAEVDRLRAEVGALRDSPTYRDAQQLDTLRREVDAAAARAAEAERAAQLATDSSQAAERDTASAATQLSDDRAAYDADLTALLQAGEHLHIGLTAPPDLERARVVEPVDIAPVDTAPVDTASVDIAPVDTALRAMTAAFRQRRGDIDDVEELLRRADAEAEELRAVGRDLTAATERHRASVGLVGERQRHLTTTRSEWQLAFDEWCATHLASAPTGDTEDVRHAAATQALNGLRATAERERATAEAGLADATRLRDDAATHLAELEARTEPELPSPEWQRAEPIRLADLIDFREHTTQGDRNAIEAALEASGLLSARLVADGVQLETGDLIAVGADPVASPLSAHLTVTIPDDPDHSDDPDHPGAAADIDHAAIERLLASISTDPTTAAATVIATTGEFRVGSLRGRHHKSEAEYVGATARKAALERARADARAELAERETAVAERQGELDAAVATVAMLDDAGRTLPSLRPIESARAELEVATRAEEAESAAVAAAEALVAATEQRWNELTDEVHRTAASLRLPVERDALRAVGQQLLDLERSHQAVVNALARAVRSHVAWVGAARRQTDAEARLAEALSVSNARRDEHRLVQTRLATIEDTVGAEVAELLSALATSEADLARVGARADTLVTGREQAAAAATEARKDAEQATRDREATEQHCERARAELVEVLALNGLVAAAIPAQPASGAADHAPADGRLAHDAPGDPEAGDAAGDAVSVGGVVGGAGGGGAVSVGGATGAAGGARVAGVMSRDGADASSGDDVVGDDVVGDDVPDHHIPDHHIPGDDVADHHIPDDDVPTDDTGTAGLVSGRAGADGLGDLVAGLMAALPVDRPEPVDAESVRMSLRRRRDSIGAGWDADARQPDETRPLVIEVYGPAGRGSLVDQFHVVAGRFEETNNLLTRKQDDALRGLLQGLIAQELATKVDEARRLIDLMNARLAAVRTSHDVGVELRWRRSPDLDESTIRLVELLSTVPDLRRAEDDDELRTLLAARLDLARREQPDQPYRQLIGASLDYRQWHELSVLLHRGGDRPVRLKRSTPLSEGEKKLVTYLPMFAAVAASCDALDDRPLDAGASTTGVGEQPGAARFLLLDDAFAKVSEDNHAKLFGLIVDLDLDLIATSERLWGTHATVPEIAITEVVRDADRGVILLEHYRWDGAVLERFDAAS